MYAVLTLLDADSDTPLAKTRPILLNTEDLDDCRDYEVPSVAKIYEKIKVDLKNENEK